MSEHSSSQPGPTPLTNRAPSSAGPRLNAPIGSIAWSSRTSNTGVRTRRQVITHSVVAPRRFDVHQLAEVAGWLDQADALGAVKLTVDLSEVTFIDQAAIDALDLLSRNPSVTVELISPSSAYSLTVCFVGRGSDRAASAPDLVLRTGGIVNARRDTLSETVAKTEPVCVQVAGALTVANAHEFRAKVADLVAHESPGSADCAGAPIVIDLHDVERLDAAGLAGVTATLFKLRRSGRRVTVSAPRRSQPARFARLTGLLPLLATPND